MSALELMRPAARSAAMRPHSTFLPFAPANPVNALAPRPASAASRCFAYLFFVPSPRPIGRQSCLVADACSHADWEHGRGWERFWEQELRAFSGAYVTVPTVPTFAGARVMRLRARARCLPSLSLGTWELLSIRLQYQELALFPSLFPAPLRVGTWEQAQRLGSSSDRLRAGANKVGPGYGDQQRQAGGARRKFRGSIAAVQAGGELGLQRIREIATRRGGNGGNRPLSERLAGHVGRVMLEGLRQAPECAAFLGSRRKLGRLNAVALGELRAAELEQLPAAGARPDRPGEAPGAPNRARPSTAMLALHAGRIWIEDERLGVVSVGHYSDRPSGGRKAAQNDNRQRGPGGARLSNGSEFASRRAIREDGKRAGVDPRRRFARLHDAGEFAQAATDFRGRQEAFVLCANQTIRESVNG